MQNKDICKSSFWDVLFPILDETWRAYTHMLLFRVRYFLDTTYRNSAQGRKNFLYFTEPSCGNGFPISVEYLLFICYMNIIQ